MSKKVKLAHSTHGRVRLRVPHAKGDETLLREVADTFKTIPGVESVAINAITGCIVLAYDPDRHDAFHGHLSLHPDLEPARRRPPKTEIDEVAEAIETEAEFLAEHSKAVRALVDWTKTLDLEMRRASGNNVDLKLVFVGGVIAATVLEIGATAATPVWMTLALFGMNHYVELHQRNIAQARAP